MSIKITQLLKAFLIISSVATISLVGAYSYASDNNSAQNTYKITQNYVLPTSQGEGNYQLLFSKNNVAQASADQAKILTLKIDKLVNSAVTIKRLSSLSMISDMKFILVPSYQEVYFQIKKTSTGNKPFEMAAQFNDKLQLILNDFKQLFFTKNNAKTTETGQAKSTTCSLMS